MSILGIFDTTTTAPWRAPPRAHQLALPGLDVALDRWDVIVAGRGAVRVSAVFRTGGMELSVAEQQPDGWVIAQLTVNFAHAWCYGLAYDEPLVADTWAFGHEDLEPGGALHELGGMIASHVAAGAGVPALLGAFLTDVVERTVQLADPRALAEARRFAPSERLRVYALVASDRTGRLAQLARVAPGLVTLMSGGTAQSAVALAIAGERVTELADHLVETQWHWPAHDPALGRLQRQWLLRAPAAVSRQVLDRVVSRFFVIDDVPDDAESRAKHYEVMAWLDEASANLPDERLLRGVTRFVSRHTLAIHAREDWRGRIVSLLRRVHRTERGPTRRASLDTWLSSAAPAAEPAFLLDRFDRDLARIERIHTRAALEREGSEMEHCAASFAERVERGDVAMFRVEDNTFARATLALVWNADRAQWEVLDLRGVANGPPTREIEALVETFVRAHHGCIVSHGRRVRR